jgi:hypothetical protein
MDKMVAVIAFMASRSPDFGKLVLQCGGVTSAGCLINRNFVENGSAKVGHGSGVIISLRAA